MNFKEIIQLDLKEFRMSKQQNKTELCKTKSETISYGKTLIGSSMVKIYLET